MFSTMSSTLFTQSTTYASSIPNQTTTTTTTTTTTIPNNSNLPSHAIQTLLSNLVTETIPAFSSSSSSSFNHKNNDQKKSTTKTYTYITPNANTKKVQESTSTLLAARALAKSGRTAQAWDLLESLFVVQGSNGFLPRYRYYAAAANSKEEKEKEYYVKDSTIPNYPLFHHSPPSYYTSSYKHYSSSSSEQQQQQTQTQESSTTTTTIHGSGRVAAPPYHASILLDVFYLSPQTSYDLQKLGYFFKKSYNYHEFLHEVVTRGCGLDGSAVGDVSSDGSSSSSKNKKNTETTRMGGSSSSSIATPCYNALHPWETELELNSPVWDISLQSVIKQMKNENWNVASSSTSTSSLDNFVIPKRVREAHDYPIKEEVYHAMLYLLEYQSNMTIVSYEEEKDHTKKGGGEKKKQPQPPQPHQEEEKEKEEEEEEDTNDEMNTATKSSSITFENSLLTHPTYFPHALLDVSVASALSKSDVDLRQVAQILYDKNYKEETKSSSTTNKKFKLKNKKLWSTLDTWMERSANMLNGLWDEEKGAYLSRVVLFDWKRMEHCGNNNDDDNSTGGMIKEKEEKGLLLLHKTRNDFAVNDDGHEENDKKNTTNGTYAWNGTYKVLDVPVGDVFLGAWGMTNTKSSPNTEASSKTGSASSSSNGDRIGSMSFRLLEPYGSRSFRCGAAFPIPSVGGCNSGSGGSAVVEEEDDGDDGVNRIKPVVSPTRNYWSARGFKSNGAIGVGQYLVDSTLHMMCGLPNTDDDDTKRNFAACIAGSSSSSSSSSSDGSNNSSDHIFGSGGGFLFGDVYDVTTGKILSGYEDVSTTCTATAAIAYDLSIPDKPFYYMPAPPISNSWVLVLIAVELAVAFTVGISCLTLSWNLMRRLKENHDSDAFVRTVRYQRYTATDLYGGDQFGDSDRRDSRDSLLEGPLRSESGLGRSDGNYSSGDLGGSDGGELFDRSSSSFSRKSTSRENLRRTGGMSDEEQRALDAYLGRQNGRSGRGEEAHSSPAPETVAGTFQQIISYANPFYFRRSR